MKKVQSIGAMTLVLIMVFLAIVPIGGVCAAYKEDLKPVRVACGINRSLYLDENGTPQGYCSDYLTALANINHWALVYVEGSMSESLQSLQEGTIDLIFPVQNISGREDYMAFSKLSGGYQPIALFAKNGADVLFNDYEAFDGSRIAVTQGGSNELALQEYAQEHGFSYTPVYYDSMQAKADAVQRGDADYIASSTVTGEDNYSIVAVLSYQPFYYATSKKNTKLLSELDSGMEHLMAEQPELAANVYLSFMNIGVQVAHTKEENEWIKSNKKIVIGVYQDTPPMYHAKNGEEAHGIYVDIVSLLAQKTGADIEIYPISREDYAYDLLRDGTIDIVLGSNDISLKTQSDNSLVYSASIMDYTTVTISSHDYVQKDAPVYILTTARQYWQPLILKESPNAVIKYCKTAKDCLVALQSGKADVTMLNAWEFNYQSKNVRFNDLIEWENHRIYADVVMAALSTADATMLSVIDKGIAQISKDEISEFVTVNLNRQYDELSIQDELYTYKNTIIAVAAMLIVIVGFFAFYTLMRKKYVDRLEKNYHKLELANKAKSEFLSRMSHDIRTPLNVILGMSRLAGENENPPDTNDCLNKIDISGKFLLGLINDVLDMERIDSGKIELNIEPYSGEEFSQYIEAVIQPLCDQKSISFEYSCVGLPGFVIMQDRLRINQVYFNLLSNAVKFTPEGGKVVFHTDCKIVGNDVVMDVAISDNGIGMSEEFQKHLFEPFAQESQKITPVGTGTGLGLSIVKRLCDMMNTKISVESKLGEGTTFRLHGVYVIAPETPAGESKKEEPDVDFSQVLQGQRFLVCEDHPTNQEIIRRLLMKKGAVVELAEDGQQGVNCFNLAAPGTFVAILMDIRMPVMDGIEATKAIRALPRPDAATIPIIALSANAYDEDVKKCVAAGMNGHLAKPIDPDKLYTELSKLVLANE